MTDTLVPDILRSVITDFMLILLIYTMSTPKYKRTSIYVVVITLITAINLAANIFFYIKQDYSAVVLIDFVMLILIAIALKPLFKDTIMQWSFSFVTLLNIYMAIVFLSYFLCDFFPHPYYGNAFLRGVFMGTVVWIFWKKAGPLYRKVKEYWHVFSLLTVVLLINYLYYFLSGDIVKMMTDHFMSIFLLILLTLFIYIGIFFSLKIIIQRFELREENIKIQVERTLLQKTTNEMKQRLSLMEDAVKQMRVAQHDRRHFNAALQELIEQGKTEQALILIERQSVAFPQSPPAFCENTEINAAVCYYAAMANERGITCDIKLNIPKTLSVDGLELAMVISNIMENAIYGVSDVTDENERKIKFTAVYTGQLIVEIENRYTGEIKTDENGVPISDKPEHGIGTQSVVSFAKKWSAELDYEISDNIFKVRMLI